MLALSDGFDRYVLGQEGRYMTNVAVDDTRQPEHKDKVLIVTSRQGKQVAEVLAYEKHVFYAVKHYSLDGEPDYELMRSGDADLLGVVMTIRKDLMEVLSGK